MYTTSSPATCQFYLTNTDISIVVVENDKYLQRILEIKDNCPKLKTIVQYTGKPTVGSVLSVRNREVHYVLAKLKVKFCIF